MDDVAAQGAPELRSQETLQTNSSTLIGSLELQASSTGRNRSEERPAEYPSCPYDSCSSSVRRIESTRQGKLIEPGLVRAVSLWRILNRQGRAFGSSEGTAADYELSAPTEEIDYFLSHSWRSTRRAKFLTLWVFFRLPTATAGAVAFSALAFVLVATGVLPAMTTSEAQWPDVDPNVISEWSMWCQLFSFFGAFLACLGRRCAEELGIARSAGCFLDKLCIHQTDCSIKVKGIRALGLFVGRSRKFLVLWSPEYFTRLWCCFELASFLQAEREASTTGRRYDIIFKPLVLGTEVMYTLGVLTMFTTVSRISFPLASSDAPLAVAALVCSVIFAALVMTPGLFTYTRGRAAMFQQLQSFSFADAECFDPRDRTIITRLLTVWHSEGEDSVAAIAEFERKVREDIGSLAHTQMSDSFPYSIAVQVSTLAAVGGCLDTLAERASVPAWALADSRAADLAVFSARYVCIAVVLMPACLRLTTLVAALTAPRSAASGRLRTLASQAAFGGTWCSLVLLLISCDRMLFWGQGSPAARIAASLALQVTALAVAYRIEDVLAAAGPRLATR